MMVQELQIKGLDRREEGVDRMGVLIMLAGDSTGSGWDYWFEYVATSERIQ